MKRSPALRVLRRRVAYLEQTVAERQYSDTSQSYVVAELGALRWALEELTTNDDDGDENDSDRK